MKATLIILTLLLAGCYASISVNYNTGVFSYTRIGGQEIAGLDIKKDGDKIRVKVQALQSERTSEVIDSAVDKNQL